MEAPLVGTLPMKARQMRWVYLLAVLPVLTDWFETGHLPTNLRESTVEIILTLVCLGFAWGVCREADQLMDLATTDSVTGMYTVRQFSLDLRREVERARAKATPLALAIIDLDGFKQVNDRFGHAEGDTILRRAASLLAASVRRGEGRCYRLGGDEFAVIFPGATGTDAGRVLDRVREEAALKSSGLAQYGTGMSGGVAELMPDEGPEALVHRADKLMYMAKYGGKNRIVTKSSQSMKGAGPDAGPVSP